MEVIGVVEDVVTSVVSFSGLRSVNAVGAETPVFTIIANRRTGAVTSAA